MSDLDAIRARHTPLPMMEDASHERTDICSRDEGIWPCDTAIVLAALDAALARERRLREALERLVITDLRDDFPDGGDIVLRWDGNRADWEAARAALAEPEAGS